MQLRNCGARRPKTYGKKKTGKSYMNSGFDEISAQDVWPGDCAALQGDTPSALPVISETMGRQSSVELLRDRLDEIAGAGQEGHVDEHSDFEGQSLDAAFEQLSITTGGANRTTASQHRSPLSPKVVNAQLSPKKRTSRLGVENTSIRQEVEDRRIIASTSSATEHFQDGCRDATGVSKDTYGPNHKRDLRPRKNPERNLRGQRKATGQGLNELKSDEGLSRLQPLLRLSHEEKDRRAPGDFQQWANELDALFTIAKIAEASYGEVYRVNGIDRTDESVLKVIPLKPLVGSRSKKFDTYHMSSVEDVLTEARTLTRMTIIPGFTNLRDIRVMRGQFPRQFVQAWKKYPRTGSESYFPDPSRKESYPKEQLWAVIEMENAGVDLEKFELRDTIQIWDIFWGVAMALAKGEELAQFEHRDLHLGNICVKQHDGHKARESNSKLNIGYSNLKSTIIDYTLSRVEMEDELDEKGNKRIAYLDLNNDPGLFNGEGDYQYDIYRYMRSTVYHADPLAPFIPNRRAHIAQGWQHFHPTTNVLWLHYLLFALKAQLEKRTKKHKRFSDDDKNDMNSKLETMYEEQLGEMEKVLDPKAIECRHEDGHRSCDEQDGRQSEVGTMDTARRVVEYALHRGWLGEKDVVECDLYE